MATTYRTSVEVEVEARKRVRPLLEERSDGRLTFTHKGLLAREIQRICGDAILTNKDTQNMETVEIKGVDAYYEPGRDDEQSRRERRYGSMFLEVWSNRNLENKRSYYERGMTAGWMQTLRCDYLLYVYLRNNVMWAIPWWTLMRWAWRDNRLMKFPMTDQKDCDQLNDTWGVLVPPTKIRNASQHDLDQLKRENANQG